MPLTVALHCSRVKKPQLVPPPALPPEYWAHHRVLSQGKRYSRPRRCQYPSSPKEYCAEAISVPKRDAPANTINANLFILTSHGGAYRLRYWRGIGLWSNFENLDRSQKSEGTRSNACTAFVTCVTAQDTRSDYSIFEAHGVGASQGVVGHNARIVRATPHEPAIR
jgi:hypothetical protein